MPFDRGSLSFRMFYVHGGLPGNVLKKFAGEAAPPVDTLGREPIGGWVSGRHLLDRDLREDNCVVAGYLHLALMRAERKIPEALLRAECQIEELAQMQADGAPMLSRDARRKIREAIRERLLPQMPPSLTGLYLAYDPNRQMAYATALPEKQVDAFTDAFKRTTGVDAIPVTPETAALRECKVNPRDLTATSFSPDCEDEAAGNSLGQDFLTWVWFFSEMRGGLVALERGNEFGVLVGGPLTFVYQGSGAHEAHLRKGMPLVSVEAKSALLAGKKLRRARLTLARGEEAWSVGLDAEDFSFRSMRLPKGEALGAAERFQERMLMLDTFRIAFLRCFGLFLEERSDAKRWRATVKQIHAWVTSRATKR